MKQKMKKALLVLCMAVCFLALSGCSAGSGNPEPIPPDVSNTMISGAEEYLREFAAFDEHGDGDSPYRLAELHDGIRRACID